MAQPQLESTQQPPDPNPVLNAEAIPPEQPNAASPTAPVGERRTRSYSPGLTLLVLALTVLLGFLLYQAR